MSDAANEPAQKHIALIWLIRGTGAFIAGASVVIGCWVLGLIAVAAFRAHPWYFLGILALLLLALGLYGIRRTGTVMAVIFAISACYFFGCLLMTTLHGQPLSSVNFGWFGDPLLALGSLALLWLLGFVFSLFAKKGYDMWRRVDKTTVPDFASVFALFAAGIFRYFLPAHLPQAVNEHLPAGLRDPFSDIGARSFWYILALYVFYKLIKAYLMQDLGLNASNPPQNQPPFDPDAPEFPQKSPLVQM